MEKMVNFCKNFEAKFLKKSKSCPQVQQNKLLWSILIFLGKGLGIVFQPHFVYDFSRKIFLQLYFSN